MVDRARGHVDRNSRSPRHDDRQRRPTSHAWHFWSDDRPDHVGTDVIPRVVCRRNAPNRFPVCAARKATAIDAGDQRFCCCVSIVRNGLVFALDGLLPVTARCLWRDPGPTFTIDPV